MADSQLLTPISLGVGSGKELKFACRTRKKFRRKLPEVCNRKYYSDSEACDYSDFEDDEEAAQVLLNAMKKTSKLPQVYSTSSDSEETPLSVAAEKKTPKLLPFFTTVEKRSKLPQVCRILTDSEETPLSAGTVKKTPELTPVFTEVKTLSKLPQAYSIFSDSEETPLSAAAVKKTPKLPEVCCDYSDSEETLLSAAAVKRTPEQKCCFCAIEDDSSSEVSEFCLFSGSDDDDYNDNIFDGYPARLLKHQRPDIDRLQERYAQQIRQSYGFEIYDYPGGAVSIVPLLKFKEHPDFGLMVKLANRAIQEYNEKECNVNKYEIIKIETANFMLSGYEQYFLTVKVLNLTLGAPIETFYIRVAKRIPDGFEEILSCGPKGVEPEFSIYGKKK